MQPCSREMEEINSLLNPSEISLQDLQNPQIQPPNSHDDFIEQMLSTIPSCSWPDTAAASDAENVNFNFDDQPTILASRLRQNQIGGGSASPLAARMLLQQQMMMQMPLSMNGGGDFERAQNGIVNGSFKAHDQGAEGSLHGSYSGLSGPNQAQQFHHPQGQSFNSPAGSAMNQSQASGSTSGAPQQPKQRVRARRGQATDPHSIAERLRRERIAERMKSLQELVPNANKTDKASMLDEIIDYVKFLQLQVKVLSMSRLGGAAAVAPLVPDMSSEGGGDCIQSKAATGPTSAPSNCSQTAPSSEAMNMTENQVAKLLEEDMGQAMQYLQGKGLCLMPISLATAISTATCQSRLQSNGGEGPSSPSMSVLTVQSASAGAEGGSGKDAASQ